MDAGTLETVRDLKETVFLGNGKPSLLARMETAENRIESLRTTLSNWDRKLFAVVIMFGTAILAFIGDVVMRHMGH